MQRVTLVETPSAFGLGEHNQYLYPPIKMGVILSLSCMRESVELLNTCKKY